MADWTDARPRSPHLQVWRWHITMATSIFHRASGFGLYLGAILIAGWLVAAASGPDVYNKFEDVFLSLPGKIVLFLFTLGIFYHLANGVRHLVWDAGKGYDPKFASLTAWLAIIWTIVGASAAWYLAGLI